MSDVLTPSPHYTVAARVRSTKNNHSCIVVTLTERTFGAKKDGKVSIAVLKKGCKNYRVPVNQTVSEDKKTLTLFYKYVPTSERSDDDEREVLMGSVLNLQARLKRIFEGLTG